MTSLWHIQDYFFISIFFSSVCGTPALLNELDGPQYSGLFLKIFLKNSCQNHRRCCYSLVAHYEKNQYESYIVVFLLKEFKEQQSIFVSARPIPIHQNVPLADVHQGSSEEWKTTLPWILPARAGTDFLLFLSPPFRELCWPGDLDADGYQCACPKTWPRHMVAWQGSKVTSVKHESKTSSVFTDTLPGGGGGGGGEQSCQFNQK